MKTPKAISRLIDSFEKLPGIGPKTAQRLVFYLLHVPQESLEQFGQALSDLKRNTRECPICFNVDETEPCSVCQDQARDQSQVCVVERPLDILAIEKSGGYQGLYHVLGGVIDPLNNIGPSELHLLEIKSRLQDNQASELIIATNPTMEGEATAMYIQKMVKKEFGDQVSISRIGRGLPTGADLEYADETTLLQAFSGRKEY